MSLRGLVLNVRYKTFKGTQQCEELNMFQCQDGSCLTKEKVCDGIPDCGQEEDELQCEKKVELKI